MTSPRRPLTVTLGSLALGAGLVLTAYYGNAWYELTPYSEADIAASTELNLQMDLQRLGPHFRPEADRLEQLRGQIRAELESEIRRERSWVQAWLLIGVLASIAGAGWLAPQIGKRVRRQ